MYCINCGKELSDGERICGGCGISVPFEEGYIPPVIFVRHEETDVQAEESEMEEAADQPKKRLDWRKVRWAAALIFAAAVLSAGGAVGAYFYAYGYGRESTQLTRRKLDRANRYAKESYEIFMDFDEKSGVIEKAIEANGNENSNVITICSVSLQDDEAEDGGDYSVYAQTDEGRELGEKIKKHFTRKGVKRGICYVEISMDGGEIDKAYVLWKTSEEIGQNAGGQYPNPISWEDRYEAAEWYMYIE